MTKKEFKKIAKSFGKHFIAVLIGLVIKEGSFRGLDLSIFEAALIGALPVLYNYFNKDYGEYGRQKEEASI